MSVIKEQTRPQWRICRMSKAMLLPLLTAYEATSSPRVASAAFISSSTVLRSRTAAFSTTLTPVPTNTNHQVPIQDVPIPLNHPTIITPGVSFSPVVVPTTRTRDLHKESTTSDVLEHLHVSNHMAPYAGPGGVAVVTGGSSGIGIPTVEALVATGMKVVMCVRDPNVARKVLEESRLLHQAPNVRVQVMDLSDLNSVEEAVQEIVSTEGRIDLLINNAGVCSVPSGSVTAQGIEMHLGVNHVGHFYLTRALLPHVRSGGRVVTVSSKAHSSVRTMHLDGLNMEEEHGKHYSPWYAYAQSKLANVLFASELQTQLDRAGIDVQSVCLHPGSTSTKLWRHNDHALIGAVQDYCIQKTPDQGAATTIYCGLVEPTQLHGDVNYVVDFELTKPSSLAQDVNFSRKFWENTEAMVTEVGFTLPTNLVNME